LTDAGTFQNVTGAIPVTSLDPPPEGKMAASLKFFLSSVKPSVNASLQLSSQGGLQMSQVVTISIDNSNNSFAIQITHGVFNEVTTVAAFAVAIVPTFSARGGAYTLLVDAISVGENLVSGEVEIICMNYERAPGTFGGTVVIAPSTGAGQNSRDLFPNLGFSNVITGDDTYQVTVENFNVVIFDSLDFFWERITATAAGAFAFDWLLTFVNANGKLAQGYVRGVATSAGQIISGMNVSAPVQRTWSFGYSLNAANLSLGDMILVISNSVNYSSAVYRCNSSGVIVA